MAAIFEEYLPLKRNCISKVALDKKLFTNMKTNKGKFLKVGKMKKETKLIKTL